jgi:hypothetical protein
VGACLGGGGYVWWVECMEGAGGEGTSGGWSVLRGPGVGVGRERCSPHARRSKSRTFQGLHSVRLWTINNRNLQKTM